MVEKAINISGYVIHLESAMGRAIKRNDSAELERQSKKWAILNVPLRTDTCATCTHFCPAKVGHGVGLQCEAWESPSALATPLVKGIDFSTRSLPKLMERIRENIDTTPPVLYKCGKYKHG